MLPRFCRLVKKNDFSRVLKRGKRLHGVLFDMVVLDAGDTGVQSKFGFVVSSKVSRRAVERNRIKRLLRSVVREGFGEIGLGLEVVLVAKRPVLGVGYRDLKVEFFNMLEKAR